MFDNKITNSMRVILIAVVTYIPYIYYVFPGMHAAFDPITFWQKLVMFFTIDLLSLLLTVAVANTIVTLVSDVFNWLDTK